MVIGFRLYVIVYYEDVSISIILSQIMLGFMNHIANRHHVDGHVYGLYWHRRPWWGPWSVQIQEAIEGPSLTNSICVQTPYAQLILSLNSVTK